MICDNFTIYYQNLNGIRSKLTELRSNITVAEYSVISLTESRIQDDNLMSSELCPGGSKYVLYRKDRNLEATNKKGGGGVVVLIRKDLKATRVKEFECLINNEDLWVQIELSDGFKILLCTYYIKPQSPLVEYEQFFDNVMEIANNIDDKTFLTLIGDANCPNIVWQDTGNGCMSHVSYEGRISESIIHSLDCLDMKQFNGILNHNNHILDLVMSNFPSHDLTVTRCEDPLCKQDLHHPTLLIELKVRPIRIIESRKIDRFNYRVANYDDINAAIIGVNWNETISGNNVNECLNIFITN